MFLLLLASVGVVVCANFLGLAILLISSKTFGQTLSFHSNSKHTFLNSYVMLDFI